MLSAHDTSQNRCPDVDFDVHWWHTAGVADDVADHVIATRELRIDLSADSDQTAWDGIHELVVVSHESDDHRLNLSPGRLTSATTLRDLTGTNGNLVTNLQATLQDSAAGHTTLERLSVLTWLVHIERANDNHVGRDSELARWDRNATDVINDDVNIIAKNSGDRHDRDRHARDTRQRLLDLLLLLGYGDLILDHQINLVLQHDNVLKAHNVDSNQMLTSLGLRVGLVTSHKKESSVHNSCTCQHSCHEGIVTWAIDEGHMARQNEISSTLGALNAIRLG